MPRQNSVLERQSEADKGKEKADRSIESDEDFEVINLPRPKSVARVRGRGPLTRVDTYGAVFSTFDVDTGWISGRVRNWRRKNTGLIKVLQNIKSSKINNSLMTCFLPTNMFLKCIKICANLYFLKLLIFQYICIFFQNISLSMSRVIRLQFRRLISGYCAFSTLLSVEVPGIHWNFDRS